MSTPYSLRVYLSSDDFFFCDLGSSADAAAPPGDQCFSPSVRIFNAKRLTLLAEVAIVIAHTLHTSSLHKGQSATGCGLDGAGSISLIEQPQRMEGISDGVGAGCVFGVACGDDGDSESGGGRVGHSHSPVGLAGVRLPTPSH
jgi:hypothetical protein